ncbi:MAG TPA: tetratricopeptide repeat protein [Patescibacteria group bacterium]|nr:tetratricopeptide repeat protein [Patescibacteria group bacterium]
MLEIGSQAKSAPSAYIRDADTGNFEELVVTASLKNPVLVDFWAPWCGPCKQMMPSIEKVVTEAAGAVTLVKINVEKYPEMAELFRVQSVPTVYAFYQGQPVDGFTGAKAEKDLRAFVDKLIKAHGAAANDATAGMPDPQLVAKIMTAAQTHFKAGNYTDAMAQYSTALDYDEKNMDALAGIGWCFVAEKDHESFKAFVGEMTDEQKAYARIKGLDMLLKKGAEAEALDTAEALQAKLEKNPKDHQARYDLALRQLSALDLEGAIDSIVELTRRDREWQEQKARKLLLELFEALGNDHPLTSQGRRRLSAVLFS